MDQYRPRRAAAIMGCFSNAPDFCRSRDRQQLPSPPQCRWVGIECQSRVSQHGRASSQSVLSEAGLLSTHVFEHDPCDVIPL